MNCPLAELRGFSDEIVLSLLKLFIVCDAQSLYNVKKGNASLKTGKSILLVVFAAFILVSCASKRPVLYPNDHFTRVGDAVARQDIEECMRLASHHGVQQDRSDEIARDTAEGAVVGATAGAAVGAVVNDVDVGEGAAAGAAGAGAGTLTRGLFRSRDPDPVYRRFVERCLRERGYAPIGWR
jgi:hypothetical protein